MSEAKEPVSSPMVHSESPVKIPSALEGTVFQIGIRLEERDDDDTQDATLTTDELQLAHPLQAISPISKVV